MLFRYDVGKQGSFMVLVLVGKRRCSCSTLGLAWIMSVNFLADDIRVSGRLDH